MSQVSRWETLTFAQFNVNVTPISLHVINNHVEKSKLSSLSHTFNTNHQSTRWHGRSQSSIANQNDQPHVGTGNRKHTELTRTAFYNRLAPFCTIFKK